MKREPVDKMEVFSSFTLFKWELCSNCNKEFRREKGWRRLVGPYHGRSGHWQFLCPNCALTISDARWVFRAIDEIQINI